MTDPTGELRPDSTTESNSAVRSPQLGEDSSPVVDQQVCPAATPKSPQSAVTQSNSVSSLLLGYLPRPEIWDTPRPDIADLLDYAKTGPYTLRKWPTKPLAERTDADRAGVVRTLGVRYCQWFAVPVHRLLYTVLWVATLPCRPLARQKRRTLADIHAHIQGGHWWSKPYAKALFVLHALAYTASWITERPSRSFYAAVLGTSARLAYII